MRALGGRERSVSLWRTTGAKPPSNLQFKLQRQRAHPVSLFLTVTVIAIMRAPKKLNGS